MEKSTFSHVTGGSVCLLWRSMGSSWQSEIVPTPGSGNSSSKYIPQYEKHSDMFGIVCKRIKIWKNASSLSLGHSILYLHSGILAIKMNNRSMCNNIRNKTGKELAKYIQ